MRVKLLIAAVAVLAVSVVFTVYSCDQYSAAMVKLNANPDYVESETLDDASGNISDAASALEYSPERVWIETHRTCNHRDEQGSCTSYSTYHDTHRIPEDCPNPYDAKGYIRNAVSFLEQTGGAEWGSNPENASSISMLEEVSAPLPSENELCVYQNYHVYEGTFSRERGVLGAVYADVEAHSDLHDAKVPSGLKSARNWSIFGIVASVLGIIVSVCFGVFVFLREERGW